MRQLSATILLAFLTALPFQLSAQLADSCKLEMGINLAGVSDFSRELPFANLMKMSREWYTKGENDPDYVFNTGLADQLSYDSNGYPTHIPQTVSEEALPQLVATVWDGMDSWPTGTYTLLWDGTGDFQFWGDFSNLVQVNANRYEFDYTNIEGGILEIIMSSSSIDDPVNNMRLLLPGTESTYETQAFNQDWLDAIDQFSTLRFMDWGNTNFWGQVDPYTWQDPTLFDWDQRTNPDFYTYTGNKGVPYELMIDLTNQLDIDAWVCIPHLASDDYISQMADLFRDNLETDRHLYVEYSNEIWNWIFGQAQWLNEYSCNGGSDTWPECIVPNIQNALDLWSSSFSSDLSRITRVAGVQGSWLDVSERMVYNLNPNTVDAVSPACYFSFLESSYPILDNLGANATIDDIALHARMSMSDDLNSVEQIKTISDSLEVPLIFYEGGQHLTPDPFGEVPTYEVAMKDIQRDTAMYNLYNEWFDSLRSVHTGTDPFLLMHFNFIAPRSAQYGSWGLLEYMNQDTNLIPAPKYAALLENLACQNFSTGISDMVVYEETITLYPNPSKGVFTLGGLVDDCIIQILDSTGKFIRDLSASTPEVNIDISALPAGLHFVSIRSYEGEQLYLKKVVKY